MFIAYAECDDVFQLSTCRGTDAARCQTRSVWMTGGCGSVMLYSEGAIPGARAGFLSALLAQLSPAPVVLVSPSMSGSYAVPLVTSEHADQVRSCTVLCT